MKARYLAMFCCVLWSSCQAGVDVDLRTSQRIPYQLLLNGQLRGRSIDALDCVFKQLPDSYRVKLVPWKRAEFEVSSQRADGYFIVISNSKMEQHASLSAPLFLEKWFWYFKPDLLGREDLEVYLQTARVGAIQNSNEGLWLADNNYLVNDRIKSLHQMVGLLRSDRIMAFLLDQKKFTGISNQSLGLTKKFKKYAQLGVYFSHSFLRQAAGFLDRFNKAVYPCSAYTGKLTSFELEVLESLAKNITQNWLSNAALLQGLQAQNKRHNSLSEQAIKELDKQWVNEHLTETKPLQTSVLNNPAAEYLKQLKSRAGGLFEEIFVMDNKGLNLASSDVTSDYWQGDEDKFKNSFGFGGGAIFIDEVEYDESTRTYLSQISITISDPDTGNAIGAITVGVNVEQALLTK